MTTLYDAKTAVFKITDNGGTLRDISPYIISLEGLPGEVPVFPITSFGDAGETYVKLKPNQAFTIYLKWSDDASVGPDVVLSGLLEKESAVAFEFYPRGNASGRPKYTGNCWFTGFPVKVQTGQDMAASASFKVDGKLTRGTVT